MYTPTAVFKNQPKEAAPPAAGLLIDDVGVDAVVAFGLRKLRAAYTGDAIRVRRASDNAEQDIGFSGEFKFLQVTTTNTEIHVHQIRDLIGEYYDKMDLLPTP